MAARADGGLLDDLAQVARQLAQWRRTHAARARIPEWLWDSAANAAARHGVSRTSTTLKLGYYDLQRRLAEKTATAARPEHDMAYPGFVELTPASLGVPCECTIELEKRDGARMRIELKGASVPDLAAVSRSFWESA